MSGASSVMPVGGRVQCPCTAPSPAAQQSSEAGMGSAGAVPDGTTPYY